MLLQFNIFDIFKHLSTYQALDVRTWTEMIKYGRLWQITTCQVTQNGTGKRSIGESFWMKMFVTAGNIFYMGMRGKYSS